MPNIQDQEAQVAKLEERSRRRSSRAELAAELFARIRCSDTRKSNTGPRGPGRALSVGQPSTVKKLPEMPMQEREALQKWCTGMKRPAAGGTSHVTASSSSESPTLQTTREKHERSRRSNQPKREQQRDSRREPETPQWKEATGRPTQQEEKVAQASPQGDARQASQDKGSQVASEETQPLN